MTINLRPYQIECVNAIKEGWDSYDSQLVVMATGLGKTTVAADVVKNFETALILAHRRELIQQLFERISEYTGRPVGIEMGGRRSRGESIVVGSVQSVLGRSLPTPELIVVDEAHHAVSSTYRTVIGRFPNAKLLGVTATPDRTDGIALGSMFQNVAYRYETPQAIADGWLAPIFTQKVVGVSGLISAVGTRKTVVFTPNVAEAIEVAGLLPGATYIHGELSATERDTRLADFRSGKWQYVVNCNVLTEGFDCLDYDTEILTEKGWRGPGQVNVGDNVYSLNKDTGLLELTPATRCVDRPLKVNEKMVSIKSQHVDIRVTEGHELHIKYRDPKKGGELSTNWLTRTALQVSARKSAYALPLAATRQDQQELNLSDDELKFIAWFMTDGGFNGKPDSIAINQSKHYHIEIRNLLNRLGFDYKERIRKPSKSGYKTNNNSYEFTIPKGNHSGKLKRNGWFKLSAYLDKNVSPQLLKMNQSQFDVFWEELLKGDGDVPVGKSGWLWCDRVEQVNMYTQLAVQNGRAVSYTPVVTSKGKTVYRVCVRKTQWITSDPSDKRSAEIKTEVPDRQEHVWCVTNKNSTLVTRRGGKVVIIGNCPDIGCVCMMRATQSRGMFMQCLGRGLRLAPGKDDCLFLDMVDMPKHSMEGPRDALAGKSEAPDFLPANSWWRKLFVN